MGQGVQIIQSGVRVVRWGIVAAAVCVFALSANAQEPQHAVPEVMIGAPELTPGLRSSLDGKYLESALSTEDNAIIDKALALDPASFFNAPVKRLRLPSLTTGKSLDMSRTDRPDGSGTVTVNKPLVPEWDATIGADIGLAANAPSIYSYNPDNPFEVTRLDRSSGAAWASVGVARFANIDARVDPNNEQGRIGTTFKHSLPVGDKFAITMQSRYSVTESLGTPQAAPSDIPLRFVPANDPAAPVPRVWDNENIAKFDILPTGTTLGAGLSTTSTDPVTHNKLSAEQKIYGPLGLATTVTDIGRSSESKSLSARLKLTW
jgi:hypothetical protein